MNRHIGTIARRLAITIGGTALVAVCMAVATGAPPSVQAQGASAVSIVDFAFQPASVTVPVGATVTWTNTGMAPHTSTSSAGGWDSGRLNSGQSFSFAFSRAGTFSYICTIHPQMMGTVVVQGAAAAPAAPPAAAPAAAQPTARPAAPAPAAQRPAAAPAAAAPQAQRVAAAPRPAAAAPAAQPAALPRSGAGGSLTVDNHRAWPALAVGGALLAGLTALAYRRRRSM
jgi:plastocyanin